MYCSDKESVLRTIELGKTNRASAPTLMNAESSRSHSIVTIAVGQHHMTSGRKKKGSLFLVDLAGSEKISKTVIANLSICPWGKKVWVRAPLVSAWRRRRTSTRR